MGAQRGRSSGGGGGEDRKKSIAALMDSDHFPGPLAARRRAKEGPT